MAWHATMSISQPYGVLLMGPFKAFGAMFAALYYIFTSMERGAKALDFMASTAEDAAEHYAATSKLSRAAELAQLRAQLADIKL